MGVSKKILLTLLILSVVSLILLGTLDPKSPEKRTLTSLQVSEEAFEKILADRSPSKRNLAEGLSFNAEELFYAEVDEAFYYSLIENGDNALNPLVWIARHSGISLAFREGKIGADLIRDAIPLEGVAYRGGSYTRFQVQVTTLPLISISRERSSERMNFRLFDNRADVKERDIRSSGTMRPRGGTSLYFDKNSYRITLTEKKADTHFKNHAVNLLDLRTDDDWILYTPFNDREKIRNVFSSNLWFDSCGQSNGFGLENGTQYRFCELILDGEYWGLYALGFPVDDFQLRLDPQRRESSYKSSTTVAVDPNLPPSQWGYEVVSKDKDNWENLPKYMEAASGDLEQALAESLDFDNQVDYYLFLSLVQGVDNPPDALGKNFYLSAKWDEDHFRFLYTPWDLDLTWGNAYEPVLETNNTVAYGLSPSDERGMEGNIIDSLLSQGNEAVWQAVMDRYMQLRHGQWSEEQLQALLRNYEAEIFDSGAYLREMNRWETGSYEEPALGLSVFTQYVMDRLNAMDQHLAAMEETYRKT